MSAEENTTQPKQEVVQTARKSRFIDENDLVQVALGDGDIIEIPKKFSYEFATEFTNEDINDTERVTAMLVKAIKKWNLVDKNGEIAVINEKNIKLLSLSDSMKVMTAVTDRMNVEDLPKDEGA